MKQNTTEWKNMSKCDGLEKLPISKEHDFTLKLLRSGMLNVLSRWTAFYVVAREKRRGVYLKKKNKNGETSNTCTYTKDLVLTTYKFPGGYILSTIRPHKLDNYDTYIHIAITLKKAKCENKFPLTLFRAGSERFESERFRLQAPFRSKKNTSERQTANGI